MVEMYNSVNLHNINLKVSADAKNTFLARGK